LLNPIPEDDDDTISVYVFGEEEAELENEARKNDGFLKYEHLAKQYGNGTLQNVRLCLPRVAYILYASELFLTVLKRDGCRQ